MNTASEEALNKMFCAINKIDETPIIGKNLEQSVQELRDVVEKIAVQLERRDRLCQQINELTNKPETQP